MKQTIRLAAVMALLAQAASAQMIIQHQGSNNPTAEGFALGNGTTMSLYPTNDAGTLAWATEDTNPADNFVYYANFSPAQRAQLAQYGWHAVWNAKGISGSAPRSWEMGFYMSNSTGNARRYLAQFELSGSDVIIDLSGGPVVTLLGGAGSFHKYELLRTNATDSAEFYIDNIFITNYAGFNDTASGIEWGSLVSARTSHVEWGHIYVEVPEPSALGLITAVSVLGLICRRNARRQ